MAEDQRTTESGIPIEPIYRASDLEGFDPERSLGEPGQDPFTRGIYPTMYRGRAWTMRQYAGFGSAAETNARFRYLLDHGQTGLSVAFDLPTQMGYDSDHTMAAAEVGKVGVAIDSLVDMRRLFEGVAKFRAARRIWADLMANRFAAEDPRSRMLRFHTQTAGVQLTAQQPLNNVVRVAYQALAAALGGTQSLHTNAYDEALALPSESAARLALRTQQVLANETGMTDTTDPLAGSYFVERLTDEVDARARELVAK